MLKYSKITVWFKYEILNLITFINSHFLRPSISWKRWSICNCWSYIMGLRLWGPRLSRSLCQSYCSIGLDSWNYWRGRNSLWSWWKRCQMHTKLKLLLNTKTKDLFIRNRSRTVVKLLWFCFDLIWISLYLSNSDNSY